MRFVTHTTFSVPALIGDGSQESERRTSPGPDVREEDPHGARLCPIAVAHNSWGRPPLHDVVRGVEGRVDPAVPWVVAYRRQLELQRLAVRIQNHVDDQPFPPDLGGARQAVVKISPVRLLR